MAALPLAGWSRAEGAKQGVSEVWKGRALIAGL